MMRCLLTLGLLLWGHVTSAADIHWQSCPQARPQTSAAAIDCGVVRPGGVLDGQPVRLAIARLRHRPGRLTEHPVVFVPGGPAEPAGLGPRQISRWQRFQQRAGWPRDIVLFDPRATGRSRPMIACDAEESDRTCRQRIGPATLAELSMATAVDDLHDIIQALDQGPAVLWAHSFGVFVVRALAARYPNDIARVILEAPAADRQRRADFADAAAQRALAQVSRTCGRVDCAITVPSTRALAAAWQATLARRPLTLAPARVPYDNRPRRITDHTLRTGILFAQYRADTRVDVGRRLRAALWDVHALIPLAAPVWRLAQTQPATSPAYWAMRCSVAEASITASASTPRRLPACARWSVEGGTTPLRSAHALSGVLVYAANDVVTPAASARALLSQAPGLAGIEVAAGGHQPLRDSACAQQRIRAWLRTGQRPPSGPLCGS